jgi:hypothetical protein
MAQVHTPLIGSLSGCWLSIYLSSLGEAFREAKKQREKKEESSCLFVC